MDTYRVTLIVEALEIRETYVVRDVDEWKARNRALETYFDSGNVHPDFSGSFVDFEVERLDREE